MQILFLFLMPPPASRQSEEKNLHTTKKYDLGELL